MTVIISFCNLIAKVMFLRLPEINPEQINLFRTSCSILTLSLLFNKRLPEVMNIDRKHYSPLI